MRFILGEANKKNGFVSSRAHDFGRKLTIIDFAFMLVVVYNFSANLSMCTKESYQLQDRQKLITRRNNYFLDMN